LVCFGEFLFYFYRLDGEFLFYWNGLVVSTFHPPAVVNHAPVPLREEYLLLHSLQFLPKNIRIPDLIAGYPAGYRILRLAGYAANL
jgi:hypothetical protein